MSCCAYVYVLLYTSVLLLTPTGYPTHLLAVRARHQSQLRYQRGPQSGLLPSHHRGRKDLPVQQLHQGVVPVLRQLLLRGGIG